MTPFQRVVVIAVTLPCLVVASLFAASGVAGLRGVPLVWPPRDISLSQAVLAKHRSEVVRQVARGADPNGRYRVTPDSRPDALYMLTPLEAAVATGELYMVRLVIANGARVRPPDAAVLACYARALGADDIERYLAQSGAVPGSCESVRRPIP